MEKRCYSVMAHRRIARLCFILDMGEGADVKPSPCLLCLHPFFFPFCPHLSFFPHPATNAHHSFSSHTEHEYRLSTLCRLARMGALFSSSSQNSAAGSSPSEEVTRPSTNPMAVVAEEETVALDPQDERSIMIRMLAESAVLQGALPRVRALALAETIRAAGSAEEARGFLLDNLAESPYLPDEMKDPLANLVFQQRWDDLRRQLRCHSPADGDSPSQNNFALYRDMVISIFSRSKKMAGLPSERRLQLGVAIHACRSKQELQNLAMASLGDSAAFDEETRNVVANDIFDQRYDLLLLPNRFDCEELPRRTSRSEPTATPSVEEDDECPICLGERGIDSCAQPCQHEFCRECIEDWIRQPQFRDTCPMCRHAITSINPK